MSGNDRWSVVGDPPSALHELLLALADDEFVTGYTNSEWTGIAPVLEEDLAFSSLAQDELGHARVFYELIAELQTDGEPDSRVVDALAYGRAPEQYRNARLVERPRGDWAYSVTRQFLYDTADYARVESLLKSSCTPLAAAAARIIREEKYHLMHAHTWLRRLAEGGDEARSRQRAALEALWPDALGLFEPPEGEAALLASGALAVSFAELQRRWIERIAEPMRRFDLPFPFAKRDNAWEPLVTPVYGGRRGQHSQSFVELYETITSVYRLDPKAQW